LALSTSSHIALLGFEDQIVGKNLWLRFSFDTAEAMGMNMVTKASEKISQYIETKYHIKCLAISGNYCSDKKATWVSFIRGRGKKVWAEATIDYYTCLEVLKTSPEKLLKLSNKNLNLGP